MRAILIDPEKRTVTEIQIGDDYKEIQKALRCDSFTAGAHLGGLEKGFDVVYVSDDNLEERDDPRFWFQIDANRNPPSSFPIAGLGLAQGVDPEGNCCDVKITAAELASRITFTERKFRGFKIKTTKHGVEVAPVAPIIDRGGT